MKPQYIGILKRTKILISRTVAVKLPVILGVEEERIFYLERERDRVKGDATFYTFSNGLPLNLQPKVCQPQVSDS